jgi:tetratricopeptide (TPR) repeat protein
MRKHIKFEEAFALIEKGYKYQRRGNLRQAIRIYKASLKLLPTAEGHTYLGWALSLLGKYKKAIRECYVAIELDEEYGNPYNDLGYYFSLFKEYDKAVEWLNKAISAPRYKERYVPYYNLGRIHELQGDWRKAVDYYYHAFSMNPSFHEASHAAIRLQALLN